MRASVGVMGEDNQILLPPVFFQLTETTSRVCIEPLPGKCVYKYCLQGLMGHLAQARLVLVACLSDT